MKLFFNAFFLMCFNLLVVNANAGTLDVALSVHSTLLASLSPVGSTETVRSKNDPTPPVNYDAVAENILRVKLALAGKYELADDITFGLYILRYLADLGDNDLGHQDIQALITSIEGLNGEPFNPELKAFLSKIKKVRFGQRRSKKYIKIYAMENSIVVPLNRPMTGLVKEVKELVVKDKARIYFEDLSDKKNLKELVRFVKSKARFFLFAPKALNQVHKDTIENVQAYTEGTLPIKPLKVEIKDIYATLVTKTIFKNMQFNLTSGVLMPGITDGKDGVPPLIFEARDGLIKAKISLDE